MPPPEHQPNKAQNPVKEAIHWLCARVIFLCVVGLLIFILACYGGVGFRGGNGGAGWQ